MIRNLKGRQMIIQTVSELVALALLLATIAVWADIIVRVVS